jgi:hypothetical protein
MSEEIKLSEEDLNRRQELQVTMQRNLLAIGDIEAAIARLSADKQTHIGEHMSLTKDIQEFNASLNEKYVKEPTLIVEE